MKTRVNRTIVYETTGPCVPGERDIDDDELAKLVANPQSYSLFVHADLVQGEGFIGQRLAADGVDRSWATPGFGGGRDGVVEISAAVLRAVVALVRSRTFLTPQQAYRRGCPDGPALSDRDAAKLLNVGLAAIDVVVKPGVRLSTLHIPGQFGLQSRYRCVFGRAAAQTTGQRGRNLKICIVIIEEIAEADEPDWSMLVPDADEIGEGADGRTAEQVVKSRAGAQTRTRPPPAPRKPAPQRRRSRRAPETADSDAAGDDGWALTEEEICAGLAAGKVISQTVTRTISLSFRKP